MSKNAPTVSESGMTIDMALAELAAVRGMDEAALSAWLGTTPSGLALLRTVPGPMAEEICLSIRKEIHAEPYDWQGDAKRKPASWWRQARWRPCTRP